MNRLKFTFKAWPVIAIATIGLCYFTQLIFSCFGIDLPEQKNVDIVRTMFQHCFDNWKCFGVCVLNTALILVILPFFEELIFRYLLFRLPTRSGKRAVVVVAALVASVLFSAAHYLAQPFPDNAFIALAFFGLAQCWLYVKTEYLWYPVLDHSLFNLTNLILLFIVPSVS